MDMQIDKKFLRQEREKRAWSQSHLAEVADLSMRTVQRIEHSGVASMESAKALATALDLELSVLVAAPEQAQLTAAVKKHRYKFCGAMGLLISVLVALGWWPAASAEQVMINLSVTAETGASTNGEMQFLNQLGDQSEIKFEQQFRLFISATRRGQALLLSTQVYDYIDGSYRLISSPEILVADNQSSAIYLQTQSSGRLELAFRPDF